MGSDKGNHRCRPTGCTRGAGGDVQIRRERRSAGVTRIVTAVVTALILTTASCTTTDKSQFKGYESLGDSPLGQQTVAPEATVQISYRRPGDSLASFKVVKFFAAKVIHTQPMSSGKTASVVRFSGGVPVWELTAAHGVLSRMGGLFGGGDRVIKKLRYGVVPPGMTQVAPEGGPPEPLARGDYYVFTVKRASGSTNLQAIRVLEDGSIEAYDAEPRAGTSYRLCCNLSPDFAEVSTGVAAFGR